MKASAMRLNLSQTTALRTYRGGAFEYLFTSTPKALLPREIKTCGDTLVAFMLAELSADNSCTSPLDGARRLRNAAMDLLQVAQRLQAMANVPADDNLHRVMWTIDVVATDVRTAALEALAVQRNTYSTATHFEVMDPRTGASQQVDLGLIPLTPAELRKVLRASIE
jgi:hypothetical protein